MKNVPILTALMLLWLSPAADGQVIISEIMYNPDSSEGRPARDGEPATPNKTEWVELYNLGEDEVSLAGWVLQDEDGATAPLPDDATIGAGEAVVLIPGDTTAAEFQAAWGDGIKVYPLQDWTRTGLRNLANRPSDTNEIVVLMDAKGLVIDQVNYDDEGAWPSDEPDGPSIYVIPASLSADGNDLGEAWARSVDGERGARGNQPTDVYNGADVGSPGHVATE